MRNLSNTGIFHKNNWYLALAVAAVTFSIAWYMEALSTSLTFNTSRIGATFLTPLI